MSVPTYATPVWVAAAREMPQSSRRVVKVRQRAFCWTVDSRSRDAENAARLNLSGADIDALLITHEHEDHIGGAARFVRRYGCDLYMSRGTHQCA